MPTAGQALYDSYTSTVVTPFPSFDTGTQPQAYQYIVSKLGIGDLRAAYLNLNINLVTYYALMLTLTAPSGVTTTDWDTVTDQLETEMQFVINVQQLFSNVNGFVNSVYFSDGMKVNYVGNMVSAEGSDSCGADVLSFLSDALWALSAVGEEAGAAFNVASALFAAVATGAGGGVTSVQAEYAALEQQLADQFNNVLSANGEMEQVFLSDWGKLQTANGLIISDLTWPPDSTTAITAASNAYELDIWQTLLPLHYSSAASIYEHDTNDANYGDTGCACVCMQQNGWATAYTPQYGGGYQAYWIVYGALQWWNPPTDACQRLFGYLGVSIYELVNNSGSWSALPRGIAYSNDPSCVPKH
jgi:hypothetical protein